MSGLARTDRTVSLDRAARERPDATQRRWWTANLETRTAVWIVSAVLGALIVGWIIGYFTVDSIRDLTPNSASKWPGLELFIALGQLFGALVLSLSSRDPERPGMRWVAMGLFVLGTGALMFGYLFPLLGMNLDADLTMYSAGSARSVATGMIAIGLVPNHPPALHRRGVLAIIIACGLASFLLIAVADLLPDMASVPTWAAILEDEGWRALPGITFRHYLLSIGAIGIGYLAVWGAVRQVRRHAISGWLMIGMVLLSGSQLHALFWPSMYSTVMTTTTLLRLCWTLVVVLGAVLELYALSRERSILLSQEQERVRQLEDLGVMKRDFTAMVAHEVGTPLAAIAILSEMIKMGALPAGEEQKLAGRILDETRLLQVLVRDFQESNTIESEDFSVDLQRVPVRRLLEDAHAYAGTVRRGNPISLEIDVDAFVIADPGRIGQVIRNLLNNAVRHTPAGTPISLCAGRERGGIRVSIVDQGPGIPQEDRTRILEKFYRGSTASPDGTGLGLYLSQRILRAHGSSMTIESEPGQGARFSFLLEESS